MKGSIFHKIILGELPCYKVYEDERTLAFLDIHPVAAGHTLVIPKNPEPTNIFDITPEDWAATCETARKIALVIEKALSCDGVNIIMNNREHAGQVVDHPHIHLIPRFKGDGFAMWPHRSYTEGEAEKILEKVRAAQQ